MKLKSLSLKYRAIFVLAIAAVISASGFAYYKSQDKQAGMNETGNGTNGGINYGPPTEQDKQDLDAYKATLPGNTDRDADTQDKPIVTPLITSSGVYGPNVEVGARVPGVFENQGTCTLKLVKGSQKVSKSQKATPNVSEMSCGFITINKSKLSSGIWSATVSYSSTKANGSSSPIKINVE